MIESRPTAVHIKHILFVLFFLVVTASCRPFIHETQPQKSDQFVLKEGGSIGQTFVAGFNGLEGFQVFIGPKTSGDGNIVMHLREDAHSTRDLVKSSLPVEEVISTAYYNFNFSPLSGSNRQYYYAFFEIQGDGEIWVDAGPGESYLEGALYQNNEAQDAQLNFRLSYESGRLFGGLIRLGFYWLWILLAGIFLFVIPGWAILTVAYPTASSLSWGEKLGIASAITLSIYPILFLWTNITGLRLGALNAYAPITLGLVWFFWKFVQAAKNKTEVAFLRWPQNIRVSDIAFLLVIGLIILTRFWPVGSLEAPMWGDSYQHTLIAQLLVENNGLFNSWQPYSELETLTYHFGFHSLVAVFHWLTKIDLPYSTLWTGQILNVLAVLGLYPLAVKIGKNRWAGVAAVFVAGLISPMPMYYINWGRYTQLAGHVILLGWAYVAWISLEKEKFNWKLIGLAAITLGGLSLTHYRVLVYAVLFFPALYLVIGRRKNLKALLFSTTFMGILAGLIFMPWFIHVFSGKVLALFKAQITTPAQSASVWVGENPIGNLFGYLPPLLWLLLPFIIGWGLWLHKRGATVIALWWYLIFLATNPNWLNLPGAGALSNFAMFIAAYMPAGILAGGAVGWIIEKLSRPVAEIYQRHEKRFWVNRNFYQAATGSLVLILILSIGAWSSRQRLGGVLISAHSLVTHPDIRAARWINQNTPPDSLFLVNTMFAYNNSLIVGTDGGWWLPLLANRKTILPPLVYGTEKGPRADYISWVNYVPEEINQKGIGDPELHLALRERGVTHIYIGQQQGRVNSPSPSFTANDLLACDYYNLIYHQDRVWIFEVSNIY